MGVLVVGAGRSGTNMTLEILRQSYEFTPTEEIEDKAFFLRGTRKYPKRYLSKCDTVYCNTFFFIQRLFTVNPNFKFVWTIRDPRDMCLSKIKNGYVTKSDDTSFKGCLADIYHMTFLYERTKEEFDNNLYLLRMEDTLLDTENTIKKLCEWLKIKHNNNMFNFPRSMRDQGVREKYKTIDKSRVELWKQWKNDKFFNVVDYDIEELFKYLRPITQYFAYEV